MAQFGCVRSKVQAVFESGNYLPEFMFYSTMGRADLVQFGSWNRAEHVPIDATITAAELQAAMQAEAKEVR